MKMAITYNLKKNPSITCPELISGLPKSGVLDAHAEWDDMETISAVRDALLEKHEEVHLIEADEYAYEKLKAIKPRLVFNMAEGSKGESRESHIPAILEMLGIPYTGSAPLTLALCLNKARTKEILSYYNIRTPGFFIAEDEAFEIKEGLKFPFIVKPLYEGSSMGIRNDSIVHNKKELKDRVLRIIKDYEEPALVEEYLEGREFTVAILGNGRAARALPIVEINFSALQGMRLTDGGGVNPIYSYEAKWILDRPSSPLDIFKCPARLDNKIEEEIKAVSIRSFHALAVRDWCRIDIRCDNAGTANVLELNPLPGILPNPEDNSCFPKAARAAGLTYGALINSVVDIARLRCGI